MYMTFLYLNDNYIFSFIRLVTWPNQWNSAIHQIVYLKRNKHHVIRFNDIHLKIYIYIQYINIVNNQNAATLSKNTSIFFKYWQYRTLSGEQFLKYRPIIQNFGNRYNFVPSGLFIFLSFINNIDTQA